MGQITRTCPHCHTKNTAFKSVCENIRLRTDDYVTFFYCGGCYRGIIAEIRLRGGDSPHNYQGSIEDNPNLDILYIYPETKEFQPPKHLPKNLTKFYLQAYENLKSQHYDASSMMSRKVLEVAVKILDPESSGNLYNRIEELAEKNVITEDIKDWAHLVRDDGNIAAHEEEPMSPEFAAEILSFTEMFLMYTFTLPGMMKKRRGNRTEGDNTEQQI